MGELQATIAFEDATVRAGDRVGQAIRAPQDPYAYDPTEELPDQPSLVLHTNSKDHKIGQFMIRNSERKQSLASQGILSQAIWRQLEYYTMPVEIGKARDLNFHDNFTALCWCKSDKASDRANPIFMGDFSERGVDKRNKRVLLYVKGKFCFCFQGNDLKTGSNSVQIGTWYHVAFVYSITEGRKIVVNAEVVAQDRGRPYFGHETIWLGSGKYYEDGDWEGQIHEAMIFKEALSVDAIEQIQVSTRP